MDREVRNVTLLVKLNFGSLIGREQTRYLKHNYNISNN